jgi:hypothetical protein
MRFVDTLAEAPPPSLSAVVSSAAALARARAAISRGWRGVSIAGLVALPAAACAMGFVGMLVVMTKAHREPVEARVAAHVLRELDRRSGGPDSLGPADREAVEIVLASRYRTVLADQAIYTPTRVLRLTPAHKTLADRILRRSVEPRSVDAAAARPEVRGMLEEGARLKQPPMAEMAVSSFYGMLTIAALLALFAALATRGVMLRLLGFEIVTADGRLAPRWRVLARAAIAWSPLLLPMVVLIVLGRFGASAAEVIAPFTTALVIQCAGAIVAIAQPSRGLQDRLAGTWIVPR